MSLYAVLRTGVSGMSAQANKLGTIADNIANVNTNGYKRASAEFSSLILQSEASDYTSGGVNTDIRYAVSQQGSLQFTTSVTDLALNGDGFLVVADTDGTPVLTRAGAFVPNGEGNLVNAAGFTLLGIGTADGVQPGIVANGLAGLVPVNVQQMALDANASTLGSFQTNMPSNAPVVAAANLPSANAGTAEFTAKSSLVAYDSLGNEVFVDVYSTKTAANEWEVAIYNKADEAATGGFPYTAAALAVQNIEFDPATGDLDAGSATDITFTVPGGQPVTLDLAGTVQLGTDYQVLNAEVNGNAPSGVAGIEIAEDGTVFSLMEDGTRRENYRIPIANVTSPDRLTPLAGNVYATSAQSGDVVVGLPGEAGLGVLQSGALEQSNVDLGDELVGMIESQRSYTANSKVFQTGADLLDVLINLKR